MKEIFNKFNEGILIIDSVGNIKLCNNVLASKLRYKDEELLKMSISEILYSQDEIIYNILNRIDNKNNITNIYSKDKKIKNVKCDVSEMEYENEQCFFILFKEINEKEYNINDLENLLDNIEMLVWIKDINGKYIYANKYLEESSELTEESIIGKYDKDIWIENYANSYVTADKEIIRNKQGKLFEERNYIDGKVRVFESYKAPILDNNKEIKNIIGISRDVTLKKRIDKELQSNYDSINTINSIINSKNDDDYIDELLESICHDFLKHLNADGLAVIKYDSSKMELYPCLELGYSDAIFRNKKSIKIKDKNEESKLFNNTSEGIREIEEIEEVKAYKEMLDEDVKYLGIYNIKLKDEFMGILNISYRNGNNPKFNQDDFIRYTCNQIATIIKNHRLSKQVKLENEKRYKLEKELELFLDTAVDLMGIISVNGDFKKVTPKWTEVLGWSKEELISMNIIDILHPEDIIYTKPIVPINKIPKEKISIKNRYLSKNGEYIWIDWTSKYIKEYKHFIVTGRDITKEKLMENQQKQLEETIQLESIKNEFFANISHEFKTPLNIILGSMQLLNQNIQQDNVTTEKLIKNVSTIKQNSYRLLRLVNNLIDMSRIDTGYYELQISNHNIVNIIEDITLSVVNYVEGKNINLIFDTNTEEEIVACDPDKIERIVLNILSNAIKYTDEKGEIIVSLKSENKKIIVSIKDNGVGIPKDKLGIIFDRFRQVNSNLVKRCEGSGIGLSLVKSLVEMHGGSIRVESEVGNGTEFIFELPICKIEGESEIILKRDEPHNQIEKCSIEFSDIYSS